MEDTTQTDTTTDTTTTGSAPVAPSTDATTAPAADTTATPPEPKPFLGEVKPATDKPAAEAQKPAAEPPKPAEEADYLKAVVKDKAILGDDDAIQLDQNLLKACVPVMQKHNISPEAANALANALAKAQIDDARARLKARVDYFEQMKQKSMQTYTMKDFEQISRGIDQNFKPGGVMNQVIRNSELGADPEFLALMHKLGAQAKEDGIDGAASGSGESLGSADSMEGLSKLWK